MTSRVKSGIIAELIEALRAEQDSVQAFDEAASALLGINATDLRCLGVLERAGAMPASDLARETGLTTGATTTLIDRLERIGYVRRTRDERDRRRVFVEMTASAAEKVAAIWGPLGRDGVAFAGRFTKSELKLIVRYLEGSRELLMKHVERIRGMEWPP